MYTRCPSCRAEISFEPPKNLADLPQGYKHRIRCPNCGVTISVKLPDSTAVAKTAPTYTYDDPNQQGYDPVRMGEGTAETKGEARDIKKADKKKAMKSCRPRSFFMLLFSLIFVAINVLAYLDVKIPYVETYSTYFNGIQVIENIIKDAQGFIAGFTGGDMSALLGTIYALIPALIFVLAGIVALINLIGLIAGKFGKTFNIIFTILVFLFSIAFFAIPLLVLTKGFVAEGATFGFSDYFNVILGKFEFPADWGPQKIADAGALAAPFIEIENHTTNFIHLAIPALGLIYFILGIIGAAIPKKRKEKVA